MGSSLNSRGRRAVAGELIVGWAALGPEGHPEDAFSC